MASDPRSSTSSSGQQQEIQRLTQLLAAANRKIDNDAHLISLSTELKQYRDTICVSCKEKVLLASFAATSPQPSGITSPAPISSGGSGESGGIINIESPVRTPDIVDGSDHPPSPLELSPRPGHGSPTLLDSDASVHGVSQSIRDPPNTNPELSPAVKAPVVAAVDYNPDIKKPLNLSVVKIFTVTDAVRCVKFSRDGRHLAVAAGDVETHIYDMITMSKSVGLVEHGTSVFYPEAPIDRSTLWTVQFSPDSKYIALGLGAGQIKIWELKRNRLRAIFNGHARLVRCIDFSPDGRFLASASWDTTVRIWRMRDGSSRRLFPSVASDFNSVTFSPNGRYVAAGNDDGRLRMWDFRTGHLFKKWNSHTGFVKSVAFHPDGDFMASGGEDHTLKSWDLASLRGRQLHSPGHVVYNDVETAVFTCQGHTGLVSSVSFSCEGRWALTSSWDRTSRIWDARTGAWLCTLKGHTADVRTADFSPAEHYLATGADDKQVMLWEYREEDQQ